MTIDPLIKLALIPLIAALIGWVTNYLAIKMLFHPKEPVNLLFFTIQGIFPKRREQLGEKLGDVVSKELISLDDIKARLESVDTKEAAHEIIDRHVDNFLKVKLKENFPMLGMFLTGSTLESIKEVLMKEIENVLPEVTGTFIDNLEKKVDIKQIVKQKVSNFSSEKLEDVLMSVLKKEFKFIEIIGAVLGFLIGIVQIFIMSI